MSLCDIYIYIYTHTLYMHINYMAYMPKLVGIFVSGTYLAITDEVGVAFGCVLAVIFKLLSFGSTFPDSMLVM